LLRHFAPEACLWDASDVYVEYWGLDTPQYKMSMYKKQTLYQQEGKRLISVHPQDLPGLDGLLTAKLRQHGYTP
jgi:hypothetical protein